MNSPFLARDIKSILILIQLKYSQLESKMSERIVQECRGLILDEANDWAIVCYPFDKFFNYSESNAVKLNWDNSEIFEKLDGSLMMLYFYDNQWNCLLYTSPSPRDQRGSRMPSSA